MTPAEEAEVDRLKLKLFRVSRENAELGERLAAAAAEIEALRAEKFGTATSQALRPDDDVLQAENATLREMLESAREAIKQLGDVLQEIRDGQA